MDKKRGKQPRRISRQYLENAALHYLQRYASSAENLRRVLKRKIDRSSAFHGTPAEEFYPVVEALVARYLAAGLLDDAQFAKNRSASLRRQGKSSRAIAASLRAKGLGAQDIETALAPAEGMDAAETELAAARAFAKRRRLGPWRAKPLPDPKAAQKDLAALGRAGFSYDVAKAALQFREEEEF